MDKRQEIISEELEVLFNDNIEVEPAHQVDNEAATVENKPDIDELIRAVFALTARVGYLESQVKELRLQALDKDKGAGRQEASASWMELRHAMQTEERALAAKLPGAAEKESGGQMRLSRVERYGKSGSKR